jgi:DNA replication protein DnaC
MSAYHGVGENRRLHRYVKAARLRTPASVEDLDFRRPRGLDRASVLSLAESQWVEAHRNLIVVGPTEVGKTWIACALAQAAIRQGHTALYLRAPRMLSALALARADGRLPRLMTAWAKVGVLVIDDLALRPLTAEQAADLLEVIEDRYQLRSTVVTSQLPVSDWHDSLGEPTIADAILDRLVHNAHRIELRGDSLRRIQDGPDSRPDGPAEVAPAAEQPPKAARVRNRAAETAVEAR